MYKESAKSFMCVCYYCSKTASSNFNSFSIRSWTK